MNDEKKPNWYGKVCPVMASGTLTPVVVPPARASSLIGSDIERLPDGRAVVQEGEAAVCVGPACMWFMPINERDAMGNITPAGGQCAATVLCMGLQQVSNQILVAADAIAGAKTVN